MLCRRFPVNLSYSTSFKTQTILDFLSIILAQEFILFVLVIGAGELGNAALKALLEPRGNGDKVAVILRLQTIESQDTSKKQIVDQLIISLGVDLEAGGVSTAFTSAFGPIFKGYDVVIMCGAYGFTPDDQRKVA